MVATKHCARSSRVLWSIFAPARSQTLNLPTFLVPSVASSQSACFATSPPCRSKIGRAPLALPPEVKLTVHEATPIQQANKVGQPEGNATVDIEGPLGKMSMNIPSYVRIEAIDEAGTRKVSILNANDKKQRAMWGTVRAYLKNHILGVSEGHTAILRLIGVGYRATIEDTATTVSPAYPGQKFVSLKVGYSHPIELGIPRDVTASVPQPTRILLEGKEKEVVMQFAAEIREWRRPEPYKGKGIFVNGETIKLKAKKIK